MTPDVQAAKNVEAIADKVRKETGITVRSFNMKKWREEAEKVKSVYNNAWERNWGFVPWTEHEMDHMVKTMKMLADPRVVAIAEDKGKPIGFAFAFPNYNEVLKKIDGRLTPLGIAKLLWHKKRIKTFRILVFGILKEYRLTGVSYLLYSHLAATLRSIGCRWAETSWQLEDNDAVNKFVISLGGKVYKKYRIYEKKLD
jgi:GNAT superfamily N-acetyltransferase